MDKTFEPKQIEQALYQAWEKSGRFKSTGNGAPYCIMLPPPNVTGSLHMGHGFQQTLMDALIRYHRMKGDRTHWQTGVDHAGIATQMVVERQLAAQGKTKHDLGRDKFVHEIWQWKEASGGTIERQMRRLGASPDWEKSRFTLDEGLSSAVQETFIRLYDEGLIYRGQRLVNWDIKFQTALSDLEVINHAEQGTLWHIRYPIVDSEESLVVATTRPETMLGDTAVAVHPEDERFKHLVGKMVQLPLTDRKIPIIADDYVDPEFGTGNVKITPAHDFNDYEVGLRHQLPLLTVMGLDAKMNEHAPERYRGLDRFEARKLILEDLRSAGLLVKEEPHELMIPRGDRSNEIVEPMLTPQWYVKAKALAGPALEAVQSGRIKFVPENWQNTYYQWLENIQDWCISRQLWWGHRIPAFYDEQGHIYVAESEAACRSKYSLDAHVKLRQDEDVLDTWYSSALWPFSTLGWPNKTEDLATFYPTSVLVTGFDIIFFWVARMVMMGMKFIEAVPFHTVYVTGLIRDHEGHKMSKSKGNVLDPIDLIDGITLEELIEKRTTGLMQTHIKDKIIKATKKEFPDGIEGYGTDPLRFTYCALASTGRDIRFDVKRLEGYRNFCNKLWNAAKFVLMNVDNIGLEGERAINPHDQFMLSKLQQCIKTTHLHFENYRFDLLAKTLHEFVWGEYCDWYIEFAKSTFYNEDAPMASKRGSLHTAITVLDQVLRLLHPVIPFITETIWRDIAPHLGYADDASLMSQTFPQHDATCVDNTIETQFEFIKDTITAIRTLRSENNLSPAADLTVYVNDANDEACKLYEKSRDYLLRLAKVTKLHLNNAAPKLSATTLVGQNKIAIDLAGLIDIEAEKARLSKYIEKLQKQIDGIENKLGNESFLKKAPFEVVEKDKAQLENLKTEQSTYREKIASFG